MNKNSKKNNKNHNNANNNALKNSQNQNDIDLEIEGDDDMPRNLLAIDAGNGIFKLAYKVANKVSEINDKDITLLDFPATVEADIKTNNDTDTIYINDKKCKANSGIKIGQRDDTVKKTNIHTVANIHYAMYLTYKETGVKKFDLAVGVTQDIFENDYYKAIYKGEILNINTNKSLKLKDDEPFSEPYKISFREEGEKEVTLEITSLYIRAEAVSGLSTELTNVRKDIVKNALKLEGKEGTDKEVKELDKKVVQEIVNSKRLWVVDLGTLTSHYTIYENRTTTLKGVLHHGYVHLAKGFIGYLEVTKQKQNDFNAIDKIIRQRRNEEDLKFYTQNIYLEEIKSDLEKYGADFERDHFLFIGGTSDELKECIKEVFTTNTTIAVDGFHANVLGMFKRLIFEVNTAREREKKRKALEREKERAKAEREKARLEKEQQEQQNKEEKAMQEVAVTKTEDK